MNLGNVSDLSLVVPITNSLTLLFTTVTGLLLGEQVYSLSKSSQVVKLLLMDRFFTDTSVFRNLSRPALCDSWYLPLCLSFGHLKNGRQP